MTQQQFSIVGKPFTRPDSLDKVLGKPIFTADMTPRDALFLAIARSTRPHAKIVSINGKAALQCEGVIRMIDQADIPGVNQIGVNIRDKPLFCGDVVREVGDPICGILAETAHGAEEAARLVDVEYAELPPVFSPEEAMHQDAVRIHPGGNVCKHLRIRKGDVELGFRESSVVVENEYKTQMQEHAPLEPEAALAYPPGREGIVTVVGPWQCIFDVQTAVAVVLNLSSDKVRIVQAQAGGAFGCRSNEITNELAASAALAAVISRKPVAMIMSREESTIAHSKRHPFSMRYKTGAKKDGTLLAEEIELILDTGAYASLGPSVLQRAIVHCTGPYKIPNVRADGYLVYTNNPYAGSFRGFGCPQVFFAAESQINCLAQALSMDPILLRMKNLLRPGDVTSTGQVLSESVGLEECLNQTVSRLGSLTLPGVEEGCKRGTGVAIGYHGNSLGPGGQAYAGATDSCGALITVNAEGHVEYRTGLAEMGTGAVFGHVQIVAETLGLTMDRIHVNPPDSLIAPFSGPTVASRSTFIGGNAALAASRRLKEILRQETASILGCMPDELEFADNFVYCRANRSKRVRFEELATTCRRKGISLTCSEEFGAPRVLDWSEETGLGAAYLDYTFGSVGVVADVDIETGYPKVVRVVAAFDCGKAINPLLVKGQIEGAIVQGLGYSTMEEVRTKRGKILNPNLADYFLYTAIDSPEIDTILVEGYPSSLGPFGAKAIAEPPIDVVAPAVVQAIFDATGVRVKELPASGEKILSGLIGLGARS